MTTIGLQLSDCIAAIITSLIASSVFWLATYWIPRIRAQKKVQQLIDYDFLLVYNELTSFLMTPFCFSEFESCLFSEDIYSGKITETVFRQFLATKCLSEDYKRIDRIAQFLQPIGEKLKVISLKVTDIINQLYVFNHYLTTEQILFCKKALEAINAYPYVSPAYTPVLGKYLEHPVDPSLRYMSKVFYDIYKLYLQIQKYLAFSNALDSDLAFLQGPSAARRMKYLFNNRRFRRVIQLSKVSKDPYISSYYFRALYCLKHKNAAKRAVRTYLRNYKCPSLSLFLEMIDDTEMMNCIIHECSKDEYDNMVRQFRMTESKKIQYIDLARFLDSIFAEKLNKGVH